MSNEPRFKVGDSVRVRAGIKDPDNPDLPIGLWCGHVDEVDNQDPPAAYLVRWDRRTRDNMPSVFLKRCELEGLEVDSMWLDEPDLEGDDGANHPLEQPNTVVARPLNLNDQEDRVRAVFGLTSDDEIPDVEEVTLRLYHAHLATRLTFPIEGRWVQEEGPQQLRGLAVKVLRLLPPDQIDPEDGLLGDVQTPEKIGVLPLADIELDEDTPQGQLIGDYTYWLMNWGGPDEGSFLPFPNTPGMEGMLPQPPRIPLAKLLNSVGLAGAVFGATVGAIHATIPAAQIGMLVASCLLAGLFGMVGRRYGTIVGTLNQSPRAPLFGLLLGVILGGIFGVLLGSMAVAFVGTVPGSIVGTIVGDLILRSGTKKRGKFLFTLLGACIGGIVLTFTIDRELATTGMIIGAIVGGVGALLVLMVALLTLASLFGRRGQG